MSDPAVGPASRLAGAGLDLSTRTDRQAGFERPGGQQGSPRQPAGQAPPAPAVGAVAGAGAGAATELRPSGLRVQARLVPAGQPGRGGASGLPVELRLLDPVRGKEPQGRAAGLVATVIGRTPERGLVLDLGGHRLALPPGAVELPIGATARLQLLLPGAVLPIGDETALDRLIGAGLGGGARLSAAPATASSGPLLPDAALAARLGADWRTLGGRSPGAASAARAVPAASGGGRTSSLELRVEAENRRTMLVDRETGWRALFGLLGEPVAALQPLTLWRRDGGRRPADEAVERLVLTLDLSRLGRVVLDLAAAPGRLRLAIGTVEPLPQKLRAALAETFVAAAELAGLEPALVFRAAPAAALPLGAGAHDHLADWVG